MGLVPERMISLTTANRSYKSSKTFYSPRPGVVKPIWITDLEINESLMYIRQAFTPKKQFILDQHVMGVNMGLMVGLPGTGKTTIANIIMNNAKKKYKPNDRNILYSDSLQYNLDHIKDCFYNLLIVDDAIENQDSTSGLSTEAKELSYEYFTIRHLFEERFDRKQGYVVTIFGTQMYKALHKRLRQASITFYTSTFNDKEENRFIQQTIGSDHYYWLLKKYSFVNLHNCYDANAFCIVKFNNRW